MKLSGIDRYSKPRPPRRPNAACFCSWRISEVRLLADAARLYELAADQGNADAQYGLGLFYESGRGGLTKSVSAAVELYKKADASGNLRAADRLWKLGY